MYISATHKKHGEKKYFLKKRIVARGPQSKTIKKNRFKGVYTEEYI